MIEIDCYYFNSRSRYNLNFYKFLTSPKIDSDSSSNLGFEIDLVTSHSLNGSTGETKDYHTLSLTKTSEK